MWTLNLWCKCYMVLRRVLLEDCGLILPLHTQRGRNQLLDRDQETLVPLVLPDQGPLDIIRQLGRLLEFITHYHPICNIGHFFLLDLCLPHIYTQLYNQFMLLRPYRGHPLIIPSLGLHLHRDRCSSFPNWECL